MNEGRSLAYDVAVIGAGSAGFAAARTAAAAGLRTVLVDGSEQLGGLCILRGCMPTKALLQCAEVLHQAQRAQVFGIRAAGVRADFAAVMQRKDRLIREFAADRRQQLVQGPFEFLRAHARFLSPTVMGLSTGQQIEARCYILSTGSMVAPSPMVALTKVGYLTSDDALVLERLPASLIVLGGGAVAVEFAQFYARLGVAVTVIQRSGQLLREMDSDAAGVVEEVFRREGIGVFTGSRLVDAWREGDLKGVSFEYQGRTVRVVAEEILFALGRVPHTEPLNLEAARVSTASGRIVTNREQQTSVPQIYAAGDCTGLHEIVHLAVQQGEIAAHNVAHPESPRSVDDRLLTTVVFSDPQVATVGLTEKAARALGVPCLSATHAFADHGKSLLMEARDGFVKLLADPTTGEILGGGVVGPLGGELIHEIIAAMAKHMTVRELAVLPHYHPTLAEIWTYPAEELACRVSP